MKTNDEGVKLIKLFEGFVDRWYPDPAHGWKVPTCCYGHTDAAGEPKYSPEARSIRFTEAEGDTILRRDLGQYERAVMDAVKVPITSNQFSALVSFTYNLGPNALRTSTLLRLLNKGDIEGAANQFPRWNKAGGKVLAGLTRRRDTERALFMLPDAATDTPLTFGSKDDRNRHIQTALKGVGLYTAPIDDIWGKGQQEALDALDELHEQIHNLIKGD